MVCRRQFNGFVQGPGLGAVGGIRRGVQFSRFMQGSPEIGLVAGRLCA